MPLTVSQLLTGGGLRTNPGPILTHGRKALDSEEQPADDGKDAAQRALSRSHPRIRHRGDSLGYTPATQ